MTARCDLPPPMQAGIGDQPFERIAPDMAVGAAYTQCLDALRVMGCDSPGRDARELFAFATGFDRLAVLSAPDVLLNAEQAARLANVLTRRAGGEPVSRICGQREFYGRLFQISPEVLDPRPDTETLVDVALDLYRAGRLGQAPRILDFGTGSGAIVLTLLAEIPDATGVGLDASQPALRVAQRNANQFGPDVARRVSWLHAADLSNRHGCFNLVVANPPYIPTTEIPCLQCEVRDFDPHMALDGGADGLDIVRLLATRLLHVVPDGYCLVEIGAGQATRAIQIFTSVVPKHCLANIWTQQDLLGHERCVAMQTRGV
ncbi:MAG: peptide chain release factor N(5)-glutamine methyltransferase [Pseudomonadota bacterium]